MKIFKIIAVAVLGGLAGWGICCFYSASNSEKAISRLESSGIFAVQGSYDPFAINGDIRDVGQNEFTVKRNPPSIRAMVYGYDDIRVVRIDSNTKISKMVAQSSADSSVSQSADGTVQVIQTSTAEVPASFSELMSAAKVSVRSTAVIGAEGAITASEVLIL